MDFNLESLKVGQSIGCCVTREGELRYFINGVDQGIAWTGLPTDRPMWGFADIYGLARKIKSEFLFGEYKYSFTCSNIHFNFGHSLSVFCDNILPVSSPLP